MNKRAFFRKIQKKFSVTYYYSTKLFPSEIRQNVQVLYSFLRLADEIVDNPVSEPRQALAKLEKSFWESWGEWERKRFFDEKNAIVLKSIRFNELESKFITEEFIKLAFELNFEKKWIEAFFKSMSMDLDVNRYEDHQDLMVYVFGSAEVVGLMMNRVMGGETIGDDAARTLGRAMQLTNFLRDIKEDFERGRIYIPMNDFKRFQVSEKAFSAGSGEDYLKMIRYEIDLVKNLYAEVIGQAFLIPANCRLAVLTSLFVYKNVLDRISANPELLWVKNFKKTFWSFPKAISAARKLISQIS